MRVVTVQWDPQGTGEHPVAPVEVDLAWARRARMTSAFFRLNRSELHTRLGLAECG